MTALLVSDVLFHDFDLGGLGFFGYAGVKWKLKNSAARMLAFDWPHTDTDMSSRHQQNNADATANVSISIESESCA